MKMINNGDRRGENDRRNSMQGAQFPIITRHGVCVRNDRRRHPDRRISKIEVGENNIDEDAFELLFQTYTENR